MELTQDHCIKINSLEEYNRFAEIADQLGYCWSTGDKFTNLSVYLATEQTDIIIYMLEGTWSPANQLTSADIKISVEELEKITMIEKIDQFLSLWNN